MIDRLTHKLLCYVSPYNPLYIKDTKTYSFPVDLNILYTECIQNPVKHLGWNFLRK